MGLLSSSQTIVRYQVEKVSDTDILDVVRNGLMSNAMPPILDEYSEIQIGWVPFETPYVIDFEGTDFQFGEHFIFSLRIDQKKIPGKLFKQQVAVKINEKLKESGREFLSRTEKTEIRELIQDDLLRKTPFTPNVYELAWDYNQGILYFFAGQKAAREHLEILFTKSFECKLIPLFPCTIAMAGLDDGEQEKFMSLTPSKIGA
jgi:DNA recombination-dependent growth factor C